MRFRLGLVSGFAAGYYLGAKAGRQRYEQINRQLGRIKRSDAFEEVTEKAKTSFEDVAEKAKTVVESRSGDGNGQGHGANATDPAPAPAVSDITGSEPPEPPKGLGGYSSSR
jgi:hypothetical protein